MTLCSRLCSLAVPCLLVAVSALGQTAGDTSYVMEVFVRDGCPHCAAAKAYMPTLLADRTDLIVHYRDVGEDEGAREDLERYSRMAGIWPPGVPTFMIQGRLLIGFESADATGPALKQLIDNQSAATSSIDLPLLGEVDYQRIGLPLFTLGLGLVDGFNPCAMWVLLFLLSLLVHLRNRKRMALIAGTFVLVSGLIYYAFMATWLNIFQWIGFSEYLLGGLAMLALLIGSLNMLEFFRAGDRFLLSIPDQAKPGIYTAMRGVIRARNLFPALCGVALLAIAVNTVELLCTAGLPAMYTAILTQQDLSQAAYYGYLGLYIVAYIADDTLMVAVAVIALSSRKLSSQSGRWLKLVSGVVMLLLGIIMLARPDWLM